jgi:hypothetical protein
VIAVHAVELARGIAAEVVFGVGGLFRVLAQVPLPLPAPPLAARALDLFLDLTLLALGGFHDPCLLGPISRLLQVKDNITSHTVRAGVQPESISAANARPLQALIPAREPEAVIAI